MIDAISLTYDCNLLLFLLYCRLVTFVLVLVKVFGLVISINEVFVLTA